jgi:hypothetical protein
MEKIRDHQILCFEVLRRYEKSPAIQPSRNVLNNLSLLIEFLNMEVEDWRLAKKPLQDEIDRSESRQEQDHLALEAQFKLRPRYLKCLFSYCYYFRVVDQCLFKIYSTLQKIKGIVNDHSKSPKRPASNALIQKVINIRDAAVTHMPSDKLINRGKLDDALSAMNWKKIVLEMKADHSPDLENLIFGGFYHSGKDDSGNLVRKSWDIEVKGILDLHQSCKQYLEGYFESCEQIGQSINSRIPFNDERTLIRQFTTHFEISAPLSITVPPNTIYFMMIH